MKKVLFVSIICVLIILLLTACSGEKADDSQNTEQTIPDTTVTEAVTTVAAVEDTEVSSSEIQTTTAAESVTTVQDTATPTILLSSYDALTVKAGEKIDLPQVSAISGDGKNLASMLIIEDINEAGTISVEENSFTAKIAGEHTLYYHVETKDSGYAEAFLTVNVTPAHENTFDEKDAYFAENMAEFKEFRDGFERGNKSCLIKSISGGAGSVYLSGETQAIEGNSMIIDCAKIGGVGAVRFYAFSEYFNFGKQTTYKLSFSYKLIEADDNFGDVYIGLSWSGMDGINRRFIRSDAKVGEVYTFTTEFTSVSVPSGKDANIMIFKLNPTDKPLTVAIDNIIIETTELEQIDTTVPTVEQLCSKDGFTWDFNNTFTNCDDATIVSVDSLSDNAKNAIKANKSYGSKLLRVTSEGGHILSGIDKDNIQYGKIMYLDIDFYAVNSDKFYIIMMGNDGINTTQDYTDSGEGDFHSIHIEALAAYNWTGINIYSQNNPDMEIYIGRITVRFSEKADDGRTPNGYVPGFEFGQNVREFGATLERNGWKLSEYDGYDFGEHAADMGSAPTKFTLTNVRDTTIEWMNVSKRMEYGYTYEITLKYYVVSFDNGQGVILYNFDNAVFPFMGEGAYMSAGYHEETITWKATKDVSYLSFYVDGNMDYNGVLYVSGVSVKLVG